MKRIKYIFIIFVCMLFLVSACEGNEEQPSKTQTPSSSQQESQQSPNAKQAAQMIKPKQLISKEDAAKILGEPLKEGAEEELPAVAGMGSCFYAPESPDSKSYLMIAILQKEQSSSDSQKSENKQSGDKLSPKKVYETLKKVFSDPNVAMPGYIGDDKYIMSQGLSILSGDTYIYISIGNKDDAKVQQMLKQAGELAVTNLKRVQGQ